MQQINTSQRCSSLPLPTEANKRIVRQISAPSPICFERSNSPLTLTDSHADQIIRSKGSIRESQ